MNIVALIPARAGSKRVPGKNTRRLGGHPLVEYTISEALRSEVFARVVLCTDDVNIFAGGFAYDVDLINRDDVPDSQPDIDWVRDAIYTMTAARMARPDVFAILRPTSPFRTADTIRRAFACFKSNDCADSIRAVEPVTQTPYKMWMWPGPGHPITPLIAGERDGVPYHSAPTQSCPPVYVQNSSLEIAWTRNVEVYGTIHGRKVAPFFTEGYEGFSIDTEADWQRAEQLVRDGEVTLPALSRAVGRVSATAETQ